jgi:hypothetical protein
MEPNIAQKSPFVQKIEPGTYWWCACGHSKSQPFCDGSHKGTGFAPKKVDLTEVKTVAWCDSCLVRMQTFAQRAVLRRQPRKVAVRFNFATKQRKTWQHIKRNLLTSAPLNPQRSISPAARPARKEMTINKKIPRGRDATVRK